MQNTSNAVHQYIPGQEIQTLSVVKEISIAAPIETSWEAMLDEIGPNLTQPDGAKMPFKLEAWPGGRYYRDLGNNAGHLWGHVQVIKPPKLLEINGPMFMSYPVASHIQYRLTPDGDRATKLKLTHRAFGLLPPDAYQVEDGWGGIIENIRKHAERSAKK
ncbi:MAG TPA: SRPBCC domain-containing protein [Tepidisphaeraceae bacterium]|jgi:hypothetical protein|nr:SRPBCC domain-containing protein [Tepidisphaeraceae bacterium]